MGVGHYFVLNPIYIEQKKKKKKKKKTVIYNAPKILTIGVSRYDARTGARCGVLDKLFAL